MRKHSDFDDDAEFASSVMTDEKTAPATPAAAPSVPAQPEAQVQRAPEEPEVDASAIVAGGVPAEQVDLSMVMAGGVPANAPAPSDEPEPAPALNLAEDPVEQNRQRILRRKRWEALLQPSYWDNAKAFLLKKVEQGGLRTDIGISGDSVIFAVKGTGLSGLIQPPKITLDLGKGTIKASGRGLSYQSLAAAYIECGVAAGFTQMWFDGPPEFMRIAQEMAKANGIEIISKSECAAARKQKGLESDEPAAVAPSAPADTAPAYDPVDEEMSTRAYR